MEKVLYEAIKPFIVSDPVMAVTLFILIAFVRWKVNELNGWIKRVETETKQEIDELREQTRDGLKEERAYRHDVITKQDERIHDLTKEVSELRAGRKRR